LGNSLGGQEINCEIIDTFIGQIRLVEVNRRVVSLGFYDDSITEEIQVADAKVNLNGPTRYGDSLRAYFAGDLKALNDWEVNLNGSEFQIAVWSALGVVPAGETRSYKWLANEVGQPTAIRAVANAVGRNPIIVSLPCHRIIATSGGLGGFTGGLWRKIKLLKHEGADCVRQGSLWGGA